MGLKKLPDEVRSITLTDARALFTLWTRAPPEYLMLSWLAQAYTTWRPGETATTHKESLEQRWKAGAMNVKQMFESMGGAINLNSTAQGPKLTGPKMPGIGPFPGAPK